MLDDFERGKLSVHAARYIADLEVAVRRGISELERIVPYVQWDGLDGEQDEAHAHATLKLMRTAVQN